MLRNREGKEIGNEGQREEKFLINAQIYDFNLNIFEYFYIRGDAFVLK